MILVWCDRRDLNPYPLGHAPQTCAYANSATIAFLCLNNTANMIIRDGRLFVNGAGRFGRLIFCLQAALHPIQKKARDVDITDMVQHAAAHHIFHLAHHGLAVVEQKINPGKA